MTTLSKTTVAIPSIGGILSTVRDAQGRPQIPVSELLAEEGRRVARPQWVVVTHPELGLIGVTVKEAEALGLPNTLVDGPPQPKRRQRQRKTPTTFPRQRQGEGNDGIPASCPGKFLTSTVGLNAIFTPNRSTFLAPSMTRIEVYDDGPNSCMLVPVSGHNMAEKPGRTRISRERFAQIKDAAETNVEFARALMALCHYEA